MPSATIAALEAAAAAGALNKWLALVPDEPLRERLRGALALDRRLWTMHPASLPSCLLVRTLGARGLSDLQDAWCRELDERGSPWIRPLRGLPVAEGLLAELHGDERLDLRALVVPSFEADDVLVAVPHRFHPSVEPLSARRRDRLRWSWSRGEARIEPDPSADKPSRRELYPRIETSGWGPAFLVRAPGGARITLPCPDEASAHGHLSNDGKRLFVYGSLEEYAGGFAWVVNPRTLIVERKLSTRRPVRALHECDREDLLLAQDHDNTLIVWSQGTVRALPIAAKQACLSPSGRYLATVGDGIRIWSLAEAVGKPQRSGLPTQFDPSGDRLLSGDRLYDGRTGAPVATLKLDFGQYLEGGPAWPWFHLGVRNLICMHGAMQAWDTKTGRPLAVTNALQFPQWFVLAYDPAGERVAALSEHKPSCQLYELPSGRLLSDIPLAGTALALSAAGDLVAARRGLTVEVRSISGEPRRSFAHPGGNARGRAGHRRETLRFSHDGRLIASFVENDGWRIWSLQGDSEQHVADADERALDQVAGFTPRRPKDWTLEAGTATTFVHRPTGTRIALPAAGPWVYSPAKPEIVASDALHVELRA